MGTMDTGIGRDLQQVAATFSRSGPQLVTAEPHQVVDTILDIAMRCVRGAAAGSVTSYDGEHFSTVAATQDAARRADAVQYEAGSGPCIAAILGEGPVRPVDLRNDAALAGFGPRVAAESGFAEMLSFPLPGGLLAAGLNLYAERVASFDDDAVATALLVATHGGVALGAATNRSRAEHLERALESSREIGTAVGVLMARHKLPREQAFDLLRTASQHLNRKIRDLAVVVVDTGSLPPVSTRSRAVAERP